MRELYPEKNEAAFRFAQATDIPLSKTARGIGKAVYALFDTPWHDRALFREVNEQLSEEAQPVHRPLEDEIETIQQEPIALVDIDKQPRLSTGELAGIMGVCIQFTCHVPELRGFAQTPFEHVDDLYQGLTDESHNGPLGFSDQLTVALKQTQGDLPEAVWRLFITSRQYARWLDSSVIIGEPSFSRDEKKERMINFSKAVSAVKPYETHPEQDTSGDTYYSWTHALGRVTFGALAKESQSWSVKAGGKAMYNGTQLMQEIAFKLRPQSMPSDHKRASEYGNAVGDALVLILQDQKR